MNDEEYKDGEQEKDGQKESKSRSSRHRRERKMVLEDEILKVSQDDLQRAREIVMIRKELGRLNAKVKSYHNQSRLVNAIVQLVIVALLLVIIYHQLAV